MDDEHDKVGMVLFATELALSREVLGPGQIFTAMLILRSELDLGGLNNASTEYLASISKRLTAMAHHTSNESDLDDKRAKRIGGLSLAALGIAGLMAKAAIETPALTLTIGSYAFGMALLIAVLMTYKLTRDASAYEKASAELKAVAGLLDSLCAKRHKTAAVPRVGTLLYPLPNGAFTTTPPSTAPVSPLHLSVEAAFLESQLTSQSQTSLLVQKSTLGSFETAHAQPAVRVAAKATLGAAVKSILEKQAAASSKPASTGEPPEPTVDRVRGSETAPTEADGVDNELDLLPEEPERHRLKK